MTEEINAVSYSKNDYVDVLAGFDAVVCEALAVSQAIGVRMAKPHHGQATHVFTRICGHAQAMICAAPLTRWKQSEFILWDFCSVAGYARSILEGVLLFNYLIVEPESREAWSAKLNVMHLNDCTRRIKYFETISQAEEVEGLTKQADELRDRLTANSWFNTLLPKLQRDLLQGKFLTIATRDEMVEMVGWEIKWFNAIWDLLSQYTHVLSFSFYRTESNGRGTGVENDFDRNYISLIMDICTPALKSAVDLLEVAFPDVARARQGINSTFSPGPIANRPPEPSLNRKDRRSKQSRERR